MKWFCRITVCLLVLLAVAGCASTSHVTAREEYSGGKKAPRPEHILIYDFTPALTDTQAKSASAAQEAENTAQRVGAEIAKNLVDDIRKMGLPSERASAQSTPQIGDLVIKGSLISMDEGDAAKRVAIGFGAGASSLKATVEGYLMTSHGLHKLGSGNVDSGGNKSPGAALGVAAVVATANPVGLIVNSGIKIYGEASGSSKVEGRAEEIAKEITKELQVKFKEQGWL